MFSCPILKKLYKLKFIGTINLTTLIRTLKLQNGYPIIEN